MNIRRFLSVIAVLLSLCLTLPMLASCGGGDDPATEGSKEEKTEITTVEETTESEETTAPEPEEKLPEGLELERRTLNSREGYAVISYVDSGAEELIIPSTYQGLPVTMIMTGAFNNCPSLKTLVIPETVELYGEEVLSGCTGLVSLTLPLTNNIRINNLFVPQNTENSVPETLKTVVVNGGAYMESMAFAGCASIESITICEGLTRIGAYAFDGCASLKSIVIPDSVTEMGGKAFNYCTSLESAVFGSGLTKLEAGMFQFCSALKEVTLGENMTEICWGAFRECTALETLTLPDSVTKINDEAFYNCKALISLEIPDGVTLIGELAFSGCTALTEIKLPIGLTYIEKGAFSGCSGLTEIVIPESVTELGSEVFANCTALTSITLGGTFDILFNAFYNCSSLTEIVIPEGVSKIDRKAFTECTALETIVIPKSVTSLSDSAFDGCTSLRFICFEGSEAEWDALVFNGYPHGGVNVVYDYTVGDEIVVETDNETETTEEVTTLEEFSNVEETDSGEEFSEVLTNEVETEVPVVPTEDFTFEKNGNSYTLKRADRALTGIVEIPAEHEGLPVTAIGDGAFRNCYFVEGVIIPESVTSIGIEVFYNCGALTEIVIPDGVESIGFGAFTNCNSLKRISLPFVGEAKKEMGTTSTLFGFIFGCNNISEMAEMVPATLKTVEITGDREIGKSAFSGCKYIESVIISGSVSVIEASAFYDCSALKFVTVPESLTEIQNAAFEKCTSLVEFNIPDNVYSIGSYAFHRCSSLLRVRIGKGVQNIGKDAFFACLKLVEVLDLSTCNITLGGTENGYVGYYAKRVYSSEEEQSNIEFVGDYGFFFDETDEEYYLVSYFGSSSDLVFPDSVNGERYSIYKNVFENNTVITSAVIPSGVKSVGGWAFHGCTSLESVEFNEGLEHLGYAAFASCPKLSGVRIPSSIVNFEDDVFNSCTSMEYTDFDNAYYLGNELEPYIILVKAINTDITSCTINHATRYIGSNAFAACSGLGEIVIPDSVSCVGRYAFSSCSSLESVTVGSGVKSFELGAFADCYGIERVYVDELNHWLEISFNMMEANPLRNIGEFYINGQLVTKLVIPEETKAIKPYVFAGYYGLVSVTLPESLEAIGEEAFVGCRKLVEICNLSGLELNYGAYDNGYVSCYANDIYTSMDYESKIKYSGDYIFYYYSNGTSVYSLLGYTGSERDIVLPEDIDGCSYDIYPYALAYRGNITSVTINKGVIKIGDNAFEKCFDLESVIINGGVDTVGRFAFWGCPSLEKVVLSASVRVLEEGAFQSSSLKKITIGMGVSEIGYAVFYNCPSLATVNYAGNEMSFGQIAVDEDNTPLIEANINYNYVME